MARISIELSEDLVSVLKEFNRPIEEVAVELIVFELFRRGTISSGKAA